MNSKKACFVLAVLSLTAAMLSACVMVAPRSAPTQKPVSAAVQLVQTLGNLAYSGIQPDQAITLTNGLGAYSDGSIGSPYVELVNQLIPTGDLNGDGTEDAAVLLRDHSTGSGEFTFLAVVLDAATAPVPTAALMIGDRIQVKSLAIEHGEVVAELIAQGESDAACCPTTNVRKRYGL
jgi:hypothetical protein